MHSSNVDVSPDLHTGFHQFHDRLVGFAEKLPRTLLSKGQDPLVLNGSAGNIPAIYFGKLFRFPSVRVGITSVFINTLYL